MYLEGKKQKYFNFIIKKEICFVFRCGYVIFTQDKSNSDLENGKNYQELIRVITTALKNKRRCQGLCS